VLFQEYTLFLRVYLILRVHLFYPEYESRAHQGWSIPPPRVRVGWGEGRKSLPLALPSPYLWWALDITGILMLSDINYIFFFDFDVSKHCLDQDYDTSLVEILSV